MKNKIRTMLALLLSGTLLASVLTVQANENVEELSCLEDAINCQAIQNEIDAYLNAKLLVPTNISVQSNEEVSPLDYNSLVRSECFTEFESRLDVCFTTVEISSQIEEILNQDEDSITLSVYEWTDISYNATEDPDVVDVMGYGTQHVMTFSVDNGTYALINDSFDELDITGACSADVLVEMELLENAETEPESIDTSILDKDAELYAVSVPYDAGAAIAYANAWCGIKASDKDWDNGTSSSGQHEAYYNTAVYETQSADCANFVSQCLVAGGLLTDSSWYPYSVAWVRASALAEHFTSSRAYTSVLATSSNIYPGNPVYWINSSGSSSGHQMICTGYNAAGVPVVNAHNSDAFRIPYTNYSSNHTLYTIQIVKSN